MSPVSIPNGGYSVVAYSDEGIIFKANVEETVNILNVQGGSKKVREN